jgi:hypothetical protein
MPIALAASLDDINQRFIAAIAALEKALANEQPDIAALGRTRLTLARTTTERVRFVHERLCPMLAAGPTPRHGAAARKLRDQIAAAVTSSNRHIGEWSGSRIAADWAGYRAATRIQIVKVRALLTMERTEIYPLIPTASPQRAAA